MPSATPLLAIPKPNGTDPANGPGGIGDVADKVEEILTDPAIVATPASLPVAGDFVGQKIWVTSLTGFAEWNGTSWMQNAAMQAYTPSVMTNYHASSTKAFRWGMRNDIVTVRFQITHGGAAGAGNLLFNPPVNMKASTGSTSYQEALGTCLMWDNSATTRKSGLVIYGNDVDRVALLDASSSAIAAQAAPFTWAVNDTIAGIFSYERG